MSDDWVLLTRESMPADDAAVEFRMAGDVEATPSCPRTLRKFVAMYGDSTNIYWRPASGDSCECR